MIKNIDKDEIRDGWIVTTQTKKLWLKMLEIQQAVDKLCRKYNITYWAACGTLLGVKQYGGFIPWDNDMDFNMLRPDFNRFIEVVDELNGTDFRVVLKTPFFIKVAHLKTTYLNKNADFVAANLTCVVVDFTPLDIATGGSIKSDTLVAQLYELYRLYSYPETATTRHTLKNDSQFIHDYLALDNNERFQFLCKYADDLFDSTDRINELKQVYKYRSKSKSLYAETVYLPFESTNLPCPAGYEQICTKHYGEFKKWVDPHHRMLNHIFADIPCSEVRQQIDCKLYATR